MTTLAPYSTPSPPGSIHTPTTPRHGFNDSWVPFSPRKSARISSRKSAPPARTPSPPNIDRHQLRSPRSTKQQNGVAMASPSATPQKKRQPEMDSSRRASGSLTTEGTAHAASALGLPAKTESRPSKASSTRLAATMLPTPAKTPRKQPDEKQNATINAIARNLFPAEEEVMPSPKKKRAKKYSGLTLDSFVAEDAEGPIQIYTDSHERIPELDKSADNPFYGDATALPASERVKRRSKRKHITIPGEGIQSVDEALRRDDGIVFVFRGKKVFRKFIDSNGATSGAPSLAHEELDAELDDDVEPRINGPLTRSAIKPRLLFPPSNKGQPTDDDEEAITDIEDHEVEPANDEGSTSPQTPAITSRPETPVAPKFAAAATPSTTARITRSGVKSVNDATPIKPTRSGKRSPFDGWRRMKSGSSGSEGQGQKRSAEPMGSVAKKARI